MANFTPGPWHYQEGADCYTHIVRDPKSHQIVVSAPQNTSSTTEANARLCAAAPTLYSALEYLIQRIDPENCGDHCDNACPWCEAKRALAKADGTENGE